jgi:serine/threonine-protein kinase
MIGQSVAHYRITAKLGEGGMGEVWRATDSKLNREVALKLCDEQFSERFQREAEILASLNHPNIAAIYGLEQNAIVMELVEGNTLKGPVPFERALSMARQLVDALEYAHEKGVIHRDLKPANIKITPDGTVKVLDFGLAKLSQPETPGPEQSTLTLTIKGAIMGTPAYMAPEQARAQEVDRRGDIWAFGVVFYEVLTGKQIFSGETVTDLLAAVVVKEPDWSALPGDTPSAIRRLLALCLAKDRKQRLQAIGDARIFFEPEVEPAPAQQATRPWLPWALAAASTLALIACAALLYRSTRPAPLRPLVRLNVEIAPDSMGMATGTLGDHLLALSPDGSRLALVLRGADGKSRLHTRLLHQSQVTPLAGAEDAISPFFSPDGEWIGFFAGGKMKKISVEGGASVTLCDAPGPRGANWGDDGNIIAALNFVTGLSRVPSSGGVPVPVTKLHPGESTHRFPQVLPGSQAVLFTSSQVIAENNDANIEIVSLKTGERKTVHRGGFSPHYLAGPNGAGHLIYLHESTLFAAPFDLGRMALAGSPAPMIEDAGSHPSAGGYFAFAQNGTFVYVTGKGSTGGGWPISWLDSAGNRQPLHAPLGRHTMPRLSPDGKRLAYSLGQQRGPMGDIWVKDLDRDTPSRLSFLPGANEAPVWSPDGNNIVFSSTLHANPGLYWIRADGSGEAQRLTDGMADHPDSISPGGKRLAFSRTGSGGSPDIFTAPIEGDPGHPKLGKPELFLGTPFREYDGAFSPDGRWLAYTSEESGSPQVYVRPFPGPGGRWQISTEGGRFPRWARGGRELFFAGLDRRIMSSGYSAKGDSFAPGKPKVWSEIRFLFLSSSSYDLFPDGKRVAAILDDSASSEQKPITHLTFLLNFFDELQRRAPVGAPR